MSDSKAFRLAEGSELQLPLHIVRAVSCKMRSSKLLSAQLEVWEAKPEKKKEIETIDWQSSARDHYVRR